MDRSRMAPTSLSVTEQYVRIGDKYIKNLLVTALPDNFQLGMLSYYASDQNVKLYMTTERSNMDIHKALRNELSSKKRELNKSRDEVVIERLKKDIISLEEYIREFVGSNDRSHNVIMVYSVTAFSKEELDSYVREFRSSLETSGFKLATLQFVQLELMKVGSPIFIDDALPTVIKNNYGAITTSTSVAGMYPYTFQTLKDPGGFLFGREKNQAGIIMFDPMLYKNNPAVARADNRLTGNTILVGRSGSGKTTTMSLILRHCIRQKMRILSIDPENKNKYLVERYGGNYVNWGSRGSVINVFDLKAVSTDSDDLENVYDTEIAMYNVIDEYKSVMRLYKPTVNEDSLDLVGDIIIKMFANKNITFETDFRFLGANDYPILEDLDKTIEQTIEHLRIDDTKQREINLLRDLQAKMKPMLTEHKYYFNGHTTISMGMNGSQILAFGTKALSNSTAELKNAMNYIMFRYAWSLCLDESIQSVLAIDEGHMYVLDGLGAEEIAIFYRRSRKYNNMCLFGTQEPQDLNSDVMVNDVAVSVHGRAIFNNSTYKIIMKLDKNGVDSLADLMTLNDSQHEIIQYFEMGDALLFCGDKLLTMSVLATEKELKEFEQSS